MLTHKEMIGLQAEEHELINARNFRSKEEYVLHLIHTFPYVQSKTFAKDKTVLDFGCNVGNGTAILAKIAKKVIGVDVSKKAISLAKKQYGNLNIDFQITDGKKLPIEDNTIDFITSFQVIEHIVDYNVYLQELQRVLSPTGLAIFTTPNALLRLDPGMKPWNKFHAHEFEHDELKKLLTKHFSDVKILGLFAEKPVYQIEKERVAKIREAERKKQKRIFNFQLRSIIKQNIPTNLLYKLKNLLALFSHTNKKNNYTFSEKNGLKKLFYRTDKLDSALDLLALCTNDGDILNGIEQKFSQRN